MKIQKKCITQAKMFQHSVHIIFRSRKGSNAQIIYESYGKYILEDPQSYVKTLYQKFHFQQYQFESLKF